MHASPTRDLIVGLFVLTGLLALGYLSIRVGGLELGHTGGLVLAATFDDVGGLSARAPVRIAGVRVGEVESIDLDDDLRARVVLDLERDLELSIDTSAAIRTAGLLGDQFIALEPGAEDEIMREGEDFAFTESALNLDKLIGAVVHGSGLGDDD
jgi:phospholipid/cholesterol/gamma-HCH transport system substrate-binding protein